MLTEREIDDLEEFCLNYTEPTKNQNFFIVKTSYRIENLISDWRELKRQNQTLQTNLADLAEDYKEFRSQNQTLTEDLNFCKNKYEALRVGYDKLEKENIALRKVDELCKGMFSWMRLTSDFDKDHPYRKLHEAIKSCEESRKGK